MWLEGAIQNEWSVSKMRNSRWETMGKRPEDRPLVEQIVITEPDEESQLVAAATKDDKLDGEYNDGPRHDGPDFGDEPKGGSKAGGKDDDDDLVSAVSESTGVKVKPFEAYDDLPADIQSAANAFKIAIIKHKVDEWSEISLDDLHGLLDALKKLATAASD